MTPPGTKLLIKRDIEYDGGFIFLTHQNVQILGGQVDKLIEKWRFEKVFFLSFKRAFLYFALQKWLTFD